MNSIHNATTLTELKAAFISELRFRAWQERASANIDHTTKQHRAEHEHAARQLENFANDLERAESKPSTPKPSNSKPSNSKMTEITA